MKFLSEYPPVPKGWEIQGKKAQLRLAKMPERNDFIARRFYINQRNARAIREFYHWLLQNLPFKVAYMDSTPYEAIYYVHR